MDIEFIPDPKTSPPDSSKPYIPVRGPDGKEQWVLLMEDSGDVEDADFDFERGKKWGQQEREKEKDEE